MSTYISDAGSRYIIKNENIKAACEWLEQEGESLYSVANGSGLVVFGSNVYGNSTFCGYTGFDYLDMVVEFLKRFCEPGSYGCFRHEDATEIAWKDEGGVWNSYRDYENPYSELMQKLDASYPAEEVVE